MTFHFVSDQDPFEVSALKNKQVLTCIPEKGALLQSTFNSANKKLYKHCSKVCNKGVKVKEAVRH